MALSSTAASRRPFFERRRKKKGKMFDTPIYAARPSLFSPQAGATAKEITAESSVRSYPAKTGKGQLS
jgi:hypothetical protein